MIKVFSPFKYDLIGGLIIPQGESVIDRMPSGAKPYLDKLIANGTIKVLDDAPKPKQADATRRDEPKQQRKSGDES